MAQDKLEMLRTEIDSRGIKNSFIADKLGLTAQGLLNKLSGKSEFTASEIKILISILGLTRMRTFEIFFE